ncbi:cytochrome P450 [Streptomyces sp. NPDC094448]|uniref:cytochrome P450 n=1 Tax=Streptomyces sp. NPDC094448 TaxID=3366063 RepID=UPI0038224535
MDDHLFHLSNPALCADPYPAYRRIRAEEPVHYSQMYGGSWGIFSLDDVTELLRDPRLTNDRAALPLLALPAEERDQFADIVPVLSDWVAFFDGEEHALRRHHLDQVFRVLEPARIKAVVQDVIDQLLTRWGDRPTVDLIADFARPLPARVISRLLGAPEEDHERLARWSDDIAYLFGAGTLTRADMARGRASLQAFSAYLTLLSTDQVRRPESLIGAMTGTRTDGFAFTEHEVRAQCMLLMFAGLEPTRYLIGNAVWALHRAPDQLRLLLSRPALWPRAVEEFLRHDTPVQYIGRRAAETFTYQGNRIQKGQVVMLFAGSANRDPAHFRDPDELRITRREARHVAFGLGPHYCIGGGLVRIQTRMALETLYSRMPDLRISTPPVWNTNFGFYGHRSLTVSR